MKQDLRGTWKQALITFFTPLLLIAVLRWLVLEPFVIPSGSMIPTLLVHDHIFVNKLAYGIRYPFSSKYMIRWAAPQVGEMIVFRYPKDPNIFFVKRVQAVAGDKIKVTDNDIILNDQLVARTSTEADSESSDASEFSYFKERDYTVRFLETQNGQFDEVKIPNEHVFVIGDNRDQSSDSRSWGFVPLDYVIGRPAMIWLSCNEPFPGTEMLCDPQTLRLQRIGKFL